MSARGILPETWDALANSTFYGESLLDLKQKYIKFSLFTTVVNASDEEDYYNPLLVEFAAKNLALTLIPAGADYWSTKLISITATGTNESKTYPDRIASLWRIHARLLQEIKEMLPQVQQYLPDTALKRVTYTASNTGRDRPYLAVDPRLWPVQQNLPVGITATSWSNNLPWSEWR